MNRKKVWIRAGSLLLGIMLLLSVSATPLASAQSPTPTMLHPQLNVRTVISGLNLPTTMAFLNPNESNELLVLEKNTGIVQHVVDGVVQGAALDLAVNFGSERGLLGIALDPNFNTNHAVYLYWSCTASAPADPFIPENCSRFPCLATA
jgi:glucose/arabinose dehydrogenase